MADSYVTESQKTRLRNEKDQMPTSRTERKEWLSIPNSIRGNGLVNYIARVFYILYT